ncbi:protein phosphatase 2C domain-containing protein [Pseudomonas sp. PDM31]|uniref:protein phosphatase 2C domain-containing protein n=1 Tax=Pseudomonas sp. PDM31 TaxID=2854778 RepID=UPI001C471C7A|nr:protein phosphatase 2C domain-containing protein [Pseudomonas sp. PDM31]MBV7477178.1 protein phosphatase 2C domain-containing protein [Pseudomonas sp. PDM31]
MLASLKWHTQAGRHTADNRDALAHAAQPNASLYLIADGSSSHPRSGELAHALLDDLTQGFGQLPTQELNAAQLASALQQIIITRHQTLRSDFPLAACSYLLLCLLPDAAFTIHEGDCCLGVIDQDSEIIWLSAVHCAPNWQGGLTPAQIAQDSSRHSLTRCFSARRASNPDINFWPARPNQHWVLASDGFWAGLCPQTQQLFLHDGHLPAPPTDDDISCLSVIANPIF